MASVAHALGLGALLQCLHELVHFLMEVPYANARTGSAPSETKFQACFSPAHVEICQSPHPSVTGFWIQAVCLNDIVTWPNSVPQHSTDSGCFGMCSLKIVNGFLGKLLRIFVIGA